MWKLTEREACGSQQSQKELEVWSVLTSDMEVQNLEFALLGLYLAFVQYFLTMLFFLHFRMVMCHFMLVECNLHFGFDYIGLSS